MPALPLACGGMRFPLVAGVAIPAWLWIWLFWHCHYEWSLNSRYNYGWAVPLLATVMLFLRWSGRPDFPAAKSPPRTAAFRWLLLLFLFPIRLLEEANPDWRLVGLALAAVAVGYTFLAIYERGGRLALGHLSFPICFALVAVPWPVHFENVVVQLLTRGVVWSAVEVAGWIGVNALPLGNVIELQNGFVGVDEACSGVKTLQAGIMVALALGEFFQLNRRHRALLVVVGCAWVFACNAARATTLVVIAARSGFDELARWHDVVGSIALLLGIGGLLGIAYAWRSQSEPIARRSNANFYRSTWKSDAWAIAWLVLIFVGTEAWYRSHEHDLAAVPSWTAHWPDEHFTVNRLSIPETTRAILHYDTASSAEWRDADGLRWWGFYARWEPSRASLQLVHSHSPDICLPAAGRTFTRELPVVDVRDGDNELRFRSYEFEQKDQPLFVFVAIEEDKRPRVPEPALEWNTVGRLRAVALGKRNLGQRLLELAVVGADDFTRARAELQRTAAGIIN